MQPKKIFALLMSFMLILSMPEYVNAQIPITSIDKKTSYCSKLFYYDSETEEVSSSSENLPIASFDQVTIEIPTSTNTKDSILNLLAIKSGIKKVSNGKFTWYFNVDFPFSVVDKPDITITATVKGNFTDGYGDFVTIASKSNRFDFSIEYAQDYTFTSTAKTGYYYIAFSIKENSNGYTQTAQTVKQLFNKSAVSWDFSFGATGKSLPKPRADWTKGYLYERPNNIRDLYYLSYYNSFGIQLDLTNYEIHHIQPLSLGGNNNFSNLIHLPKELHTKITSWYKGY